MSRLVAKADGNTVFTSVEKAFIAKSGRQESYPGERAPTIEVLNVYELGKLVALSFLEWVTENPTGVIALPTGKTPEYFIKTLTRYFETWNDPQTERELLSYGFKYTRTIPDTSNLTFVMLDEFFPMLPTHRNSFCKYIREFYCKILKLRPENINHFDLIEHNVLSHAEFESIAKCDIDLTLLTREASNEDERAKQTIYQKAKAFCDSFEEKVRALGGIGFFLGGIGPDGHIAFNQEGAPHNSRTRLVGFNYPSAAAAASDLGGIEVARGKAAMTIGLETICFNKNAKIVIMAAGEGKAKVIREGIEEEAAPARPSSVLQSLPNSRFYITHGAANLLTARNGEKINKVKSNVLQWALNHLSGIDTNEGMHMAHYVEPNADYLLIESMIYNLSLKIKTPVHKLKLLDLYHLPEGKFAPDWLLDNQSFQIMVATAARRLREKVEGGLKAMSAQGKRVLHTAPHHDDIMLSYHGAMHEMLGRQPVGTVFEAEVALGRLQAPGNEKPPSRDSSFSDVPVSAGSSVVLTRTRSGSFSQPAEAFTLGERFNKNLNYFANLTSGFHSVNDEFMKKCCVALRGEDGQYKFLDDMVKAGELHRDYDDLMNEFHDAFFAKNVAIQAKVEDLIFLRKCAEVYMISKQQSYPTLIAELKEKVEEKVWKEYILAHQPGDAVPKDIQLLKGCMRESEDDRVWALSRMPMSRIHHMRSKFYTDDFFCPMPNLEDDAMPVANLIKQRQPDIISVAFDPEGTGPDTHYKVLQVVAAGLGAAINRQDIDENNCIVWGYRNVWFVFSPADTTLMIPCTAKDLDLMHETFMACFTTQKSASFPSPSYDGPFSAWARQIQIDQMQILTTLLGQEYFDNHRDLRIRSSGGFIFIKAMKCSDFLANCEQLKSKFENVSTKK